MNFGARASVLGNSPKFSFSSAVCFYFRLRHLFTTMYSIFRFFDLECTKIVLKMWYYAYNPPKLMVLKKFTIIETEKCFRLYYNFLLLDRIVVGFSHAHSVVVHGEDYFTLLITIFALIKTNNFLLIWTHSMCNYK